MQDKKWEIVMIKVIEGYKVKQTSNIQDIFIKLRTNALQFPGFISAENLISEKDASITVFLSTWDAVENWRAWEISSIRQELYLKIKGLLEGKPKVSIYRLVPTHW